jgi:hypothetical protein
MNETILTQVFCSQCDLVTSDFIEFGGEFYCQEQCVAFLPTFESMEEESASRMATELSVLMDEVESDGYVGSSDEGDARMIRIMELANFLQWFYPERLDPRFS